MTGSEVAPRIDGAVLRYAQCWEDADILVEGLDVRPGQVCLSIASAGDNTLALLTRDPARVIAVDLSAAQIAALELRVAACRTLDHGAFLELYGARPSGRRAELYGACRPAIASAAARAFWDGRADWLAADGFGAVGRFEDYVRLFRRYVLPLVHGGDTVRALLAPRAPRARRAFFDERWNTGTWRALFRVFFSRPVMSLLGRDPAFFRYARGDLAGHLLGRVEHALADLDPAENPYLHWILRGRHGSHLPLALRAHDFAVIRERLDRVEWHCTALEDWLDAQDGTRFVHRFNLSDVFEYMSEAAAAGLLERLAGAAVPGGRLLYWNMLVPRSRPAALAGILSPLEDLAAALHARDKVFFYRRLVIEEIIR